VDEFKFFQQKRKLKQFVTSLVFIAILSLGWYVPLLGYFIPLCMLLGVAVGLARGRKWCDWYCPRGSFYDVLVSPISPKRNIPALFKNMIFRVSVLSLLMLVMGINLVRRWPDPFRIGMFLVGMVTVTTILGVILALIFHPRSWCTVCPIGTAVNLIGRNKAPLKIDSDLCVECKLCAKACPVQLKLYFYKGKGIQIVREADCLRCGLCLSACPKKALSF